MELPCNKAWCPVLKKGTVHLLRKVAAIRNTRAWQRVRPAYLRFKQVIPVDNLFPLWVRSALGIPVNDAEKAERPSDRGIPEIPDEAILKERDESAVISRDPDHFVLFRIIGNDIVPRHRKGQSRRNVEWILRNEPVLAACEKRWLVNRIIDEEERAAIISLLENNGQPYDEIRFSWQEYAGKGWDFEGLPWPGFSFSDSYDYIDAEMRQRLLNRLYRFKNNYVINNNGARNACLEAGRSKAKWILPWDGNCFVTEQAWSELREAVQAQPWHRYFLVPMARISANERLLDKDFLPAATEEPQLIFRSDAKETFNEEYFYGRRPKVEMFWRLGVPGKWDEWRMEPWDLPYPPYAEEVGSFAWSGWVARLSSGESQLEVGARSESLRREVRGAAVTSMLRKLDAKVLRERIQGAEGLLPESVTSAEGLSGLREDLASIRIFRKRPAWSDVLCMALSDEHPGEISALNTQEVLVEICCTAWEKVQHPGILPGRRSRALRAVQTAFLASEALRRIERREHPSHSLSELDSLAKSLAGVASRGPDRSLDIDGTWHDLAAISLMMLINDYESLVDRLRLTEERVLAQSVTKDRHVRASEQCAFPRSILACLAKHCGGNTQISAAIHGNWKVPLESHLAPLPSLTGSIEGRCK